MEPDRALPASLEAERAVLGAIVLHNPLLAEAGILLEEKHFFRDAHRRIYRSMLRLAERSLDIDFLTLKDDLTTFGDLEEIGGPSYLASLVDGLPKSAHIESYVSIVLEKARMREVIYATSKMLSAAYDADLSADVLIDESVTRLLTISTVPGKNEPVQIGKAVMDYAMALDQPVPAGELIPTGFIDLDEYLSGGIRAQELVIIAARPGVGKTSLALNIAETAARLVGPTAYFSLEMSTTALAARELSSGARVDGHKLRMRALSEADYLRISALCTSLQHVPLMVQDTAATLAQVTAWCHRLQQGDGLKCVVVDYMQLMIGGQQWPSMREAVSAISGGLKRLGKDLNIPVIALSQLSRAPDQRSDKRPQLSDLRESGALEQDADVVLLIFREEMHNPTDDNHGIAEVIIAKQRNGPTGVVRLAFISQWAKFENLAQPA